MADPEIPLAFDEIRRFGKALILIYHDVEGDGFAANPVPRHMREFFVTLPNFQNQMHIIAQPPFDVWPVLRLVDNLRNKRPLPFRPIVAITFDDGWSGNLQYAAPVLLEHHLPATFYITWDYLEKPHCMSKSDVRELHEAGFEIGSHGVTHRFLSTLSADELKIELGNSRQRLEDLVGDKIRGLAIPGSNYSAQVLDAAFECGYDYVSCGFSGKLIAVPDDRRCLSRIAIKKSESLQSFVRLVQSGPPRHQIIRKHFQKKLKRIMGLKSYALLHRLTSRWR